MSNFLRLEFERLRELWLTQQNFKFLKVFYYFYKITSSLNYNMGNNEKRIYFTDQNLSSYNINLTMASLNWPIKTYISNSGDGMFTTRVSLSQNHVYILSRNHASRPIRARVLS